MGISDPAFGDALVAAARARGKVEFAVNHVTRAGKVSGDNGIGQQVTEKDG